MRRDLRLSDNGALSYAVASGRPVIPVFIYDELPAGLGAASKWRLGLGLEYLKRSYNAVSSRLILRAGDAQAVLDQLISETGARSVVWNRLYEPKARMRDVEIKKTLKARGLEVKSFEGMLLFEPWSVETGGGSYYRVYTPFWNNVRQRNVTEELPSPKSIQTPSEWPSSDILETWCLADAMNRGADVVEPYLRVGEAAAHKRLDDFIAHNVQDYKHLRDIPSRPATSDLSENLALGEISPARCWHACRVVLEKFGEGAEIFLKELAWREFAYHLMYHTPHILSENWKSDWDQFPWKTDESAPHVLAWKQGRTGIPFVDAAMREMYVTGRMHNRGRMIVASYLTKHLMFHWKIGQRWFEECLVDWDPASNAMGWQWSSGSGPDATPFFRIFNAETQLQKFDPSGKYVQRWVAELSNDSPETALDFFDAIPKNWKLNSTMSYCNPIVTMSEGRKRALDAYKSRSI